MFRRPTLIQRSVAFALLVVAGGGLLAACGGKDPTQIKVAEVGNRVITLDYFERKMNTIDPQFLPPEINTREGRLALLETMINKEVMAIKAEELGLAQDGRADHAAKELSTFAAVANMRYDVRKGALEVTEDEIYDYYENFARNLKVRYMIFDWEKDAIEAKRLVEGGEDWAEVAKRSGAHPENNDNYTRNLKYGTIADNLEEAVFSLQVGEICDPVDSPYGFFVVKLEGQEMVRVQPLEDLRERIVASIQKRKDTLLTDAFLREVFEDYGFKLERDAVETVYAAMPPDAPLDPPTPKDQLEPLKLAPVALDMPLMSYADQVWTVGRYNDLYNESTVFGRPRRERGIAGLRRQLMEIAVRDLMPLAAEDRGYLDAPEILDQYKERRERGLVERLHKELIADQVVVAPEEVEAYWAANSQEFANPERREVLSLVAGTEEKARAAYELAQDPDVNWDQLLASYGAPGQVMDKKGRMGTFTPDSYRNSTTGTIAFEELTYEGEVSYPREVMEGQWLLVKLNKLTFASQPELDDVRLMVGERVQAIKAEEMFQRKVEEWKTGMFVRRYEQNVDKAVYDPSIYEEKQRHPQGLELVSPGGV